MVEGYGKRQKAKSKSRYIKAPEQYERKLHAVIDGDRDIDKGANKVLFVCDRRACNECSSDMDNGCRHTSNIKHAKNFKLNGNIFVEIPPV